MPPRWALAAALLLLCAHVCARRPGGEELRRRAQEQQRAPVTRPDSAEYDRNALVAFKAGGDPLNELDSWTATGDLCSRSDRWFGVWCDDVGGDGQQLLTSISLALTRVRGDVGDLGGVIQLRHMDFRGSVGVHGSIARLRALRELCFLDLSGTSVHGSLEHLSALHALGRPFNTSGPSGVGRVDLRETMVYGDVADMRALPGLGPEWSNFSSCAHFGRCEPSSPLDRIRGLGQLQPQAEMLVGADECACCVGDLYARGTDDGSCDRDPRCMDTALQAVDCGENALCSAGSCICRTGWQGPGCRIFPGGAETDVSSLRAFGSRGLVSWHQGAVLAPCARGGAAVGDIEQDEQEWWSVWTGVKCKAERVVQLVLACRNAARRESVVGSIEVLSPGLSQLQVLDLAYCSRVSGNIRALLGLPELRLIDLKRTLVWGDVAQLATLGQMSLELNLEQTPVYGSVAPLRAIPALGESWDSYTPCSLQLHQPSAWTRAHTEDILCGNAVCEDANDIDYGIAAVKDMCSVVVPNASDVAGLDPCACCLGGADRSSVHPSVHCSVFASAVPVASIDADVGPVRPWTGAEIRDAEPLIFVILALLACGLLVRTYAPVKAGGIGLREFLQAYWEHTIGVIDSPGTESRRPVVSRGLGARVDLDRNDRPANDSVEALSTPRAPAFMFNGSGSIDRQMETASEETRIEVSENPLHSTDSSGREEADL